MDERIRRVLESIAVNMGPDALDSIKKSCGSCQEEFSSGRQAEFVKDVIDKLEQNYGADAVKKVLTPCGYQCISNDVIAAAKDIYAHSENLDVFLFKMNEKDIGGGKLRSEDGKIIAVYDRCYCGLPVEVKNMNPLYCNCSAGWCERLFSSVLGRDVEVRRIGTILEGCRECTFEIIYQ